jgi:uncharacterized protein
MPKKPKETKRKITKPAAKKRLAIPLPPKPTARRKKSPTEPYLATTPQGPDVNGRKFVLTPSPEPPLQEPPAYEYLGELPETYGTKSLYLVARDPHFLYAYWDWSWEQYQEAARAAHDGKVFLELSLENGERVQQLQISEGVRSWYLQVNRPDTTFFAQLGYYTVDGKFAEVSRSRPTTTPRDNLSWKMDAKFVTIPFHLSFRELWELVRAHGRPGEDLAEILARLQEEGFEFAFGVPRGQLLGEASHQALLDYLGGDLVRRIQVGSLEITEILRRRFQELQSSGQWSSSVSSPFGASFGAGRERNFHLHVNAELIIYGGTDPKARVRVDGQEISLRPDGTFSYHFAFPDGQFHIPIEAVSPDGEEMRSALLSFLRLSAYAGDVRKTGQPPLPAPLGRVD